MNVRVTIDPAHGLTLWLAVFLNRVVVGLPLPPDLTLTTVKRVTAFFTEGVPRIILHTPDGTMIQLTCEVIVQPPATAEFDPPLRLI